MSARAETRQGPGRAATVTLLLASSLTIMAGATIAPSLPDIEAHFGETENAALLTRLVLTLPALFIVISAPFAGWLADRHGRQKLLAVSAAVYGVAGMSGMLMDSLAGLLIGRAALGIAVSGIMTATTALAGDYFSGAARDRFVGLQIAFNGFGGLVFLLAGGFLADLDWRAPFAIYGAAFILLPAILLHLAPKLEPVKPGGTPSGALGPLPILPLAGLCAIAFLNFIAFYLIPTQLPYLLREVGVASSGAAGIAVGLSALSGSIASLSFGRLKRRYGGTTLFAIGFLAMATGHAVIAMAGSYGAIIAGVGISGLGMGLVMPNFSTSALALASPANRGRVAGYLSSAIFLGQFASPLAAQPVIAASGISSAFQFSAAMLGMVAVVMVMRLIWSVRAPAI